MKKLILAAVLAVAPALVMADPVCDDMSEHAEVVMRAHQSGVSMKEVMAVIDKNLGGESVVSDIYKSLVIDAYSQPRYHTDASKARKVADFRDQVHVFCLKSRKGK